MDVMKKAIIFDLWNTLVVRRGRNITDIVSEYFKLPREEVHEWIRIASVGKEGIGKYAPYKTLCLANGKEFLDNDKDFVDGLYSTYSQDCSFIAYAQETLVALREMGFKVAVLSNTTDISKTVIDHLELADYVDLIVLSCDEGYLKPDPRIFNRILSELNMNSNEVIMVGDKITTDILGAKIVGMDVIYFNQQEKQNHLCPHMSILAIVNQLSGIPKLLKTELL